MRTDHRPWPIPSGPWMMKQEWHDLLFAHWPLPANEIQKLLPTPLTIDTFDGKAWVGVVPFIIRGIRPRGIPPFPGLSQFPELNVRTYVTWGGKPGVFFFSLDASNRPAVLTARKIFGLPYMSARMRAHEASEQVVYSSSRQDPAGASAEFHARYRPDGEVFHSEPGSLDYFLTERYCLYVADRHQDVWRTEIHHDPWPLQPARMSAQANTMTDAAGINLPDSEPVLHFSKFIDVRVWWPEKVTSEEKSSR